MNLKLSTLFLALRLSIVAGVAYWLGFLVSEWTLPVLQEIGGLWSAISGILVFKQGYRESFRLGLDRILGTLIGCFIGALYLSITPSVWFLPLAILAVALICLSVTHLEKFNTPACLACAVVIVVWQLGSKTEIWLFSLSRFVEAGIGVIIALVAVHIPPPKNKWSFLPWKKS